jgi:hypothetical protein
MAEVFDLARLAERAAISPHTLSLPAITDDVVLGAEVAGPDALLRLQLSTDGRTVHGEIMNQDRFAEELLRELQVFAVYQDEVWSAAGESENQTPSCT